MNRITVIVLVIVSVISLPACNTVQGLGKDIEKSGQAIERVAR